MIRLPLLPTGRQRVTIVSAKEATSSKGNQMITLTLHAAAGGSTFKEHLVATDSGIWKLHQFLAAIGETVDDKGGLAIESWHGREAEATLTFDDYQGVKRLKVAKWEPAQTNESKEAKE